MDLLELLRSLRIPMEYDNNLPGGGGPPRSRDDRPAVTKGDIRRHEAQPRPRGALFPMEYENNLPAGGPPRARMPRAGITKGDIERARAQQARAPAPASAPPAGALVSPDDLMAMGPDAVPVNTEGLEAAGVPLRIIGNAARLPMDVGADLLRGGVHGALGLEEAEPMRYTGQTTADLVGALDEAAAPVKRGVKAASGAVSDALSAAREALIAEGARPVDGAKKPAAAPAKPQPKPAAPKRAATAAPQGALGERPIDTSRPKIQNADGSFSTERTITIEADGRHYLIPTIVGGKQLDEESAIAAWKAGKNPEVGVFATAEEADQAAKARSKRIGQVRGTTALPGAPAPAPAPTGALADAAPAVPAVSPQERQSLQAAFEKRVAEIEQATGQELTKQQKAELQMDFFLRLMASGSRKGSTLIGNVGESGLQTSALSRRMRDKNADDARARRKQDIDLAFKEVSLMGSDADAAARDRQIGQRDRRLDQLERQLSQGQMTVKQLNDGSVVIIDAKTGTAQPVVGANGRPLKLAGGKDDRPVELKLLEHLRSNPQDLEMLLKLRGKGGDGDDAMEVFAAASKRLAGDVMGSLTPEQAVREAQQMLNQARGRGAPAGPQKPDPVANKGRTISGPDGRFKSDGKQWVKID